MKEYYTRCRNCGDRYLYRINGMRWGKPDYTSEYCPECQAAVREALAAIPKKFEPREKDVDPSFLDEINSRFRFSEYQRPNKTTIIGWDDGLNYSVYMDGHRYTVFCEEREITCSWEYDIARGEFTDRMWEYEEADRIESFRPWLKKGEVEEREISEPEGVLMYMDFFNLGDI